VCVDAFQICQHYATALDLVRRNMCDTEKVAAKHENSPALMQGSLECGDDGCKIVSHETSDEAETYAANECNFSSPFESGLGQTVNCRSSPKTELGSREYSVYKAADLLYSFHLNEIVNDQQCANDSEERDGNKCRSVRNCAVTVPEYVLTECCSSARRASTDATVISCETNIDGDAHLVECDSISSTENGPKTDTIDSGATHPTPTSDFAVAATTTCCHSTRQCLNCVSMTLETVSSLIEYELLKYVLLYPVIDLRVTWVLRSRLDLAPK